MIPLYPRGHQYPFTKQISIACQSLPISAAFDYVDDKGAIVPYAQFEIGMTDNSNAAEYLQKSPIKLRVRVDQNGLILISSASISYEKLEVKNEPMEQSGTENEKMDTDSPTESTPEAGNDQQNADELKRKTKPKLATLDLTITPSVIVGKFPKEVVQKYLEFESNLILADKNWKEKTDAKNALEEFIYEWRDRLESGSYDPFINSSDKFKFQEQLSENESWLYKQEEEELLHSKSVYDERTNKMKNAFADAVLTRKREFENRPRVLEQLGQRLQQASKLVIKVDPEEVEDVEKFKKEIEEKGKWFEETSGKLTKMLTTDDPPVKCEQITQQLSLVEASMTRLNNSRSRRAEQKRKEEEAAKAAAAAAAAEAAKKAAEQQKKPEATEDSATPNGTTEKMDVDEQQPPAAEQEAAA